MRGDQDLWSDERVALLERLWREGVTASAIGVQLGGISRSAVLGKINRLRRRASRLAPSATRQFSTTGERPSLYSPQTSPARRRGNNGGDRSESAYAAAKACRKRLLELTNDSCRWPLGNSATARFFFCGAPEANLECGIPYCQSHMRRAYLTPSRPARKGKSVVAPMSEPTLVSPSTAASRGSCGARAYATSLRVGDDDGRSDAP